MSFLLICPLILQSCLSNEIYFNLKTQEIYSCNFRKLRGLDFTLIDENVMGGGYLFLWQDSTKNAPTKFSLRDIPNEYKISPDGVSQITPYKFKLRSNSKYKINRFGGDASSYSIIIITNSEGKVIKTDHNQCGGTQKMVSLKTLK